MTGNCCVGETGMREEKKGILRLERVDIPH
jgi:hypothetical protein